MKTRTRVTQRSSIRVKTRTHLSPNKLEHPTSVPYLKHEPFYDAFRSKLKSNFRQYYNQ